MANFQLSNWAKAQLRLADAFNTPEMKHKLASIYNVFSRQTEFTIEGVRNLKLREDRPQEAYFLTRQKRTTTGSARSFQHSGVDGDSAKIDITFDSFVDKFSVSLKRTDNNLYNFTDALNQNLLNAMLNIHEDVETAAYTYLDTNKSQVNIATRLGSFETATPNYVWETPEAQKDDFFRNNKSMMRQNFYGGPTYNVIADPAIAALAEKQMAQGQGNQTNLGYQFPGIDLVEATEIDDATYTKGISYFTAPNTLAVIDWIPVQNRNGVGSMEYATKDNPFFTNMIHPTLGVPCAVHFYKEGADTSASNGDEQDVVWQFEVSVDLSFNHAPLSTANATPILACGIV